MLSLHHNTELCTFSAIAFLLFCISSFKLSSMKMLQIWVKWACWSSFGAFILQYLCFDAVCWATGRASSENRALAIPNILLWETALPRVGSRSCSAIVFLSIFLIAVMQYWKRFIGLMFYVTCYKVWIFRKIPFLILQYFWYTFVLFHESYFGTWWKEILVLRMSWVEWNYFNLYDEMHCVCLHFMFDYMA